MSDYLSDRGHWERIDQTAKSSTGIFTVETLATTVDLCRALVDVHDHIAGADRYAANEARQREDAADASGDRSFAWAEYRREYQPNPRELNAAHKAFLAGWEARSEEEAECSRCGEQYPGTAEATLEHHRACTGETPENPMGDPLDEADHRDRIDGNGERWTRRAHLWCPESCTCYEGSWKFDEFAARFGPLTFAPDASPGPQDAAQDAAEGKDDAVEGGGAAGPPGALAQQDLRPHMEQIAADAKAFGPPLCHRCRHGINWHGFSDGCDVPGCTCLLWPSAIARHLIAQAVAKATGLDEEVTLPEGWTLDGALLTDWAGGGGWVLRDPDSDGDGLPWAGFTFNSLRAWCTTRQKAVDWIIEQAGGERG